MTMRHAVDQALADRRLQFEALGAFAIGAALLAALGLYGLLASLVGERRREIGIRMALGANRGSVRRLVARQILVVTATGLGLGLLAALFASRLVAPFLYAISPRDPIAISATCAALLALVAAASYVPLRRATSVDPAEALRIE
jgi:ABC-type antimicrobial peptide transport system permease subunit